MASDTSLASPVPSFYIIRWRTRSETGSGHKSHNRSLSSTNPKSKVPLFKRFGPLHQLTIRRKAGNTIIGVFWGLGCILSAPRIVQKSAGEWLRWVRGMIRLKWGGCWFPESTSAPPAIVDIADTTMDADENTGRLSIVQKSRIKFDYRSWGWKDVRGGPQSHYRYHPFIRKLSNYFEWWPRIPLQLRQTSTMTSLKD